MRSEEQPGADQLLSIHAQSCDSPIHSKPEAELDAVVLSRCAYYIVIEETISSPLEGGRCLLFSPNVFEPKCSLVENHEKLRASSNLERALLRPPPRKIAVCEDLETHILGTRTVQ